MLLLLLTDRRFPARFTLQLHRNAVLPLPSPREINRARNRGGATESVNFSKTSGSLVRLNEDGRLTRHYDGKTRGGPRDVTAQPAKEQDLSGAKHDYAAYEYFPRRVRRIVSFWGTPFRFSGSGGPPYVRVAAAAVDLRASTLQAMNFEKLVGVP